MESASRSSSAALIVHLPSVVAGRDVWQKNESIRRASRHRSGSERWLGWVRCL